MVNLPLSAMGADSETALSMEVFAYVILLQFLIGNLLGAIQNIENSQKHILDAPTCQTGMPRFRMVYPGTMMDELQNALFESNSIDWKFCRDDSRVIEIGAKVSTASNESCEIAVDLRLNCDDLAVTKMMITLAS